MKRLNPFHYLCVEQHVSREEAHSLDVADIWAIRSKYAQQLL